MLLQIHEIFTIETAGSSKIHFLLKKGRFLISEGGFSITQYFFILFRFLSTFFDI